MSVLVRRDVRATAMIPPHDVSDYFARKALESLSSAYFRGDLVNPVVFIARVDRKYIGLVGSHRIRAMQRRFKGLAVPQKYTLVLTEKTVRDAFRKSPRLTRLLDLYLVHQLDDHSPIPIDGYTELVHAVAALAPELQAALADQTPWEDVKAPWL